MSKRILDAVFVLLLIGFLIPAFLYWRHFKRDTRLKISEFEPISHLVTTKTQITRAKFPVFDTHAHLNASGLTAEQVIAIMDSCNVKRLVNLEIYWMWGDFLKKQIETYQQKYPDRFLTAANINFDGIDDPDYSQRAVQQLVDCYEMGARVVKVHRNLGLHVKDKKGIVRIDDPRLDPVWKKCGELGMPVIFHIADPTAYWLPPDRYNERYQSLQAIWEPWGQKWGKKGPIFRTVNGSFPLIDIILHPERLYYQSMVEWKKVFVPNKIELLVQRDNVIRKHPETIFIGAHMGSCVEDLEYLSKELDELPNYYVDLSYTIPDLGRQPYSARKFFLKYQDRIIFGIDGPPEIQAYQDSFRFLETKDEYFDYPRAKTIPQGNWKIYGIGLPDEVLKKIYYQNAEKIFPAKYE